MIGYIKGTAAMFFDGGMIVENSSGIGFKVFVPAGSALYKYSVGDTIQVFTEMVVKEDDISLYGFHNRENLDFFKLLITVNGIGPKGALAILGAMSLEELKRAIAFGDVKEISRANGVGKKTAERLVLELKDKVGDIGADQDAAVTAADVSSGADSDARQEAIAALISLGYSKQEAFAAVAKVADETLSSEEYIKKALKNLF